MYCCYSCDTSNVVGLWRQGLGNFVGQKGEEAAGVIPFADVEYMFPI
jgi:hypothetical protein